jgi:hypothetical protein
MEDAPFIEANRKPIDPAPRSARGQLSRASVSREYQHLRELAETARAMPQRPCGLL